MNIIRGLKFYDCTRAEKGCMQRSFFFLQKFSNTKHISHHFCQINQTNLLPANTLIGLTNCEMEKNLNEAFERGKEADFYPSVQMRKAGKSKEYFDTFEEMGNNHVSFTGPPSSGKSV